MWPMYLMSVKPKWIFAGVGLLSAGLIITLAWHHYSGLVQELGDLRSANSRQALALEIQGATVAGLESRIHQWREAEQEWRRTNDRLARQAADARAEVERLNDIFAEHDLTRLAIAKPGLVENRINAGTRRANGLLECASSPGGCDPSD